jgi:thiamine biosynthesis lipoprotein
MGTLVALSIDASDEDRAQAGLDAAWQAIQRVDLLMHPSRSGSDLAQLNAVGPGAPVTLHPWTMALLRLAGELHRDSQGVFDPCLPDAPGRLGDLQLHADGTAGMRAPLLLDLGGIAKGFAVDRAIEAARAAGCSAALVNAGGDLRVSGERREAVELGRAGGPRLELVDAALAVSADSAQAPPEHRGFYSRVPQRTRIAASAAVIAPTAAVADALSKCALFLPAEDCARLFQRWRARLLQLP